MAEVIGLVSGILTLIDFGCKVISGTRSVRETLHGTAPNVHELDLLMVHIKNSHQAYLQHLSAGKKKLGPDDSTHEIMQASERLQTELSEVISKLKIPEKAHSRTLESWRVGIRLVFKEKYLGNLRQRLLELNHLVSNKIAQEMQGYVPMKVENKRFSK